MLIERNEKMRSLEELYHSDNFEFLVPYDRWRVSKKPLLINKPARTKAFSFQRKKDSLNLVDFSRLDSVAFYPEYSHFDQLIPYGILGGIPCYLLRFINQ